MSSYNLYKALKAKAAGKTENQNAEVHLDDVSRVKVLSPGRQVFKRFIYNRLAVFGSILLIVMFAFSFAGPLFYGYGQKEIFYKYDYQNVNYALAKENTAYTGYVLDDSVQISNNAANMVNTNVKAMLQSGATQMIFFDGDGCYALEKLGEGIYTLGAVDAAQVCSFGTSKVDVGQYDAVSKKMTWKITPAEGNFEASAMKACKGTGGEFEFGGVTYTAKKAAGKKFDITANMDGFIYTADALGEEFEAAAQAGNASFSYDGTDYVISESGASKVVYKISSVTPGKVYTNLSIDTVETGAKYSAEFRNAALLAAYGSGAFEADGASYSVANEDGSLVIYDADGAKYAEFTAFVIRRYNGEDTMELALKDAIRATIADMNASGTMNATMVHALPMQNENGEYSYDEDGNLLYNDTELRLTQKDTGEYVINCDQIIYLIDMYASPSATHILGTDGDGFDVFARLMYGGRISLMVGFIVVFLEIILGVIMGGLAGYYGGWVDNLVMRLVDIFYCLPTMPIMIILGSMMDAMRMDTYIRLMVMMAALGIMGWASIARMVRGQILSLREQEFMIATEATGIKVKDRIFRHLVPNVMPQLIVIATMGVGSVILTESTLSFLGLGVKHPLATWGTMINSVSSASAMAQYPYIWIPVGLLICLTVIAFNFVGDGLRDAYDPKSKR